MVTYRVIIPVHNPPKSFLGQLESIASNQPDAIPSLIVVDDGSSNGVVELAKERFPSIEVLKGDGNLWWAGGMRMGMAHALDQKADAVIWLNHDCLPDSGTLPALAELAARDGTGAVSAWCYCRENPAFGVNPGFRNWHEIPVSELEAGEQIKVDGVNGNCTAISGKAIRQVGLPHTDRHPHYGDGPYTWRLHQGGFKNFVAPSYRAALEREFERCITERDHSSFWNVSLREKLTYYFFSNRSKHHWRNRFYDLIQFRGHVLGTLLYPLVQLRLMKNVAAGHRLVNKQVEDRLEEVLTRYAQRFPKDCLRRDLNRLLSKTKQ
jgi:GT2 family glycosyltransferase